MQLAALVRNRRRGSRAALVLVFVVGSAVGLATTTASAAKKPPQLTAADRQLFQYAACMRSKGVKIPDPVRSKNGKYAFPKIPTKVLNAPGVKKKAQACAAQLPGRRQNTSTPAQQAAFKKFSDCMAKNGVKINRPTGQPRQGQTPPSGQRPQTGGFFNSKDPKVKKALAKCQKYAPRLNQTGP